EYRLAEGQEAGHHKASSQEKAMHRGVPPEGDGWILIRGLLLVTPSSVTHAGYFNLRHGSPVMMFGRSILIAGRRSLRQVAADKTWAFSSRRGRLLGPDEGK